MPSTRVKRLGVIALLGTGACAHPSQGAAPPSTVPVDPVSTVATPALPPASQAKRAVKVAVFRVDDAVDPLANIADVPAPGIEVRSETAPPETAARRNFLRAKLEKGETLAAATARLKKVTDTVTLPPGKRFAFEPTEDFNPETGQGHIDGVRSFVLTGTPIVTEDDVVEAKVEITTFEREQEVSVVAVFRPNAAKRFAAATGEWVGRRIAILRDDMIAAAPLIKAPVTAGRMSIPIGSADQKADEARDVADALSVK